MNNQPSVLIVDDDEGMRRTLEMILAKKGYQPFMAATGETALAFAQERFFNIALLDVRLPDIAGTDLLARLKSLHPDLEVLIISGHATLESAIQALAVGAFHYFIKPLNMDEVLVTIEKALEKQHLALENRRLLQAVQKELEERRGAEEALAAERNLLRTVIDNLPDRVYAKDTECRFILNSAVHIRSFGATTQDQVLGKTDFDFRPAGLAAVYFSEDQQVLQTGNALYDLEVPAPSASGEKGWVLVTKVPLRDKQGKIIGLVGISRDITKRKRAEEALRVSEERFRIAAQSASDLIWEWNIGNGKLEWFGDIDALLGYAPGEFPRTIEAWEMVIHSDDHDRVMATLDRHLKTRAPYDEQYRVRRKDGTLGYWTDRGVALWDEQGNPYKMIGVCTDITERKRAEEALEKERGLLRTLIDNLPDRIYAKDAAGRFLLNNLAHLEALGVKSQDEAIGKTDLDLRPPEIAEQHWADDQRVLESGELLLNREEPTILPSGDRGWLLTTKVPVRDREGKIRGLVGISRNITARRQRERELQALVQVSRAMRVAQTRAEMLPIILDQLIEVLNAGGAAIALCDLSSGETVVELARGGWTGWTGIRLPQGEGISGDVIATGKPYLNRDVRNDSRMTHLDLLGDLPAVTCIPLIAHQQSIGVLWVGRKTEITYAEVGLLTAIADIAANAIHRETLHEQTEQRLRQLTALHIVDQTISGSLDLRFTLDILVDQVVTQLRVDAADILLFNPTLQTLEYAAGRGFRARGIERFSLRLGEGYTGRIVLERRAVNIRCLAEPVDSVRAHFFASEGFVSYYGFPLIAKGGIKGVLEVFQRTPLDPNSEWLNFLELLAGQAAIAIDNAQLFDDVQQSNTRLVLAYDATIEGWSRALDLRDEATEGHTQRVAQLTEQLARAVGVSETELIHIRRGALLHDIGKMAIPDSILRKPSALTAEEWHIMRKHPEYALELLNPIAYLRSALDIPYFHHEKWDGSGYPRGLKGEQIPLAARVFAVIDVWDALRSDRPYRAAWTEDQAFEHIRQEAGKHFDPKVVEQFLKMIA